MFSSQDLDALGADAELVLQDALIHLRGGLTPSRGSFPCLLTVRVVLG